MKPGKLKVKQKKGKIERCVISSYNERSLKLKIATETFATKAYTDILFVSCGFICAYSQARDQTDIYKDGKFAHSINRKLKLFAAY